MDQVTQQNAAMVEQSTAATHSLKGETAELARLISRFRTAEGDVAASRSAPRAAPANARPAASPVRAMTQRLGAAFGSAAVKPVEDGWEEF